MKRMWTLALVALVALSCMAAVANAFDGERQGFILGIGAGTGLTSYAQTISYGGDSVTSDRENELPIMTDFKVGYAPNDALEIYWMSKVSWFGMENALGDDVTVANGVAGLGITYFLEPGAPSIFLTGGVGYSSWALPFEEGVDAWYGLGVSAGAGYEFMPHWYVEGDIRWGNPSTEDSGFDISASTLSVSLTLNVIAY